MYPTIDTLKTGQRIKELMILNHLTPLDIQEYLNLSCVQSVYRWFSGRSIPTIDHFYALSYLFGVPVDDMIIGDKYNHCTKLHFTFQLCH
ncbi:MAG: helix-turn-helix domain-containing protein [Erysipelotrichaceae bacterium]|nr:helix-turn-helix domain-containing protein [Erysipelotrichaceae bacterium]